MRFIKLLINLSLVVLSTHASQVQASEQGRYALILGNNRGSAQNVTLDFAESDAKRVYQVLTEFGRFPKDNVRLLLGADVDQAWQAAYSLDKLIAAKKRESGQKNLLFVFFSGHAESDALELGETWLRFRNLLDYLKSSSADVRIAVVDSCKSGRFVSLKNSQTAASNQFHVSDEINSKGYAIITSSAHNELSQESAEIRGAYFTHYLVSALRGAGDKSNDGKVTLNEAYDYAYTKTRVRTTGTMAGTQHPMYEFQLEGRGEIILTYPGQDGGAIVKIHLPESGKFFLLDEKEDQIIAEVEIRAGHTTTLSVTAGEYVAYFLTPDNQVRRIFTKAAEGKAIELSLDLFQPVTLAHSITKGGLFARDLPPAARSGIRHAISLGGLMRRFPLEGGGITYGAAINYRFLLPSGWQPSLRLHASTRDDVGLSTGYRTFGLHAGGGHVWRFSKLAMKLEALAGVEYFSQHDQDGIARSSSGFNYQGLLGLEYPLGSYFVLIEGALGGRVFQVLDDGWVHRLDALAIIGLGWSWEGSI